MSDNKKLLPCPFCGGAPVGPKQSSGSDERCGYNFTVSIECPSCGAKMTKASHQDNGGWCNDNGEAKAEAIEAWNRRAAQPVVLSDAFIQERWASILGYSMTGPELSTFRAILVAKEQA